MKEYFLLQFKLSNRTIKDFGLYPVVGYIMLLASFTGFSLYLFHKTGFAEYIYLLLFLGISTTLSETKRNEFLKLCFSLKDYRLLRIFENLALAIPFFVFLLFRQSFAIAALLVAVGALSALVPLKTSYNYAVPSPFNKRLFEFTIGFRNTFFIFPVAYALTIVAINVDNFNLGIFSLLLVFLTVLGFYPKPENEFYVWSYSLTPKQFLSGKLKTALIYSTVLVLPVIMALLIFYPQNFQPLLIFLVAGYIYLATLILTKYSVFPEEMNLLHFMFFAFSIIFPPLLLALIPYFFNRSVKQLGKYLE